MSPVTVIVPFIASVPAPLKVEPFSEAGHRLINRSEISTSVKLLGVAAFRRPVVEENAHQRPRHGRIKTPCGELEHGIHLPRDA
jgi:hypothetical protein